jgi:hypothetical protein
MSTQKYSVETAVPVGPALHVAQKQPSRWLIYLRSPLGLCFLVALIVRALLVIHTNGAIDGDEAIVGMQAQHIVQGEHPIYFYGIPYFGSLEAYLLALVFAVAGSSVWTLRVEPALVSLVIVWLTWRLAGILAEKAQLSTYGRRYFMLVTALFAAVCPLYDLVLESRTYGGYVEIFAVILALLLATLQLTNRWSAGARKHELAWRWAVIGCLIGLGFWVDPIIISAVLAATLWIVGYCVLAFIRSRRTNSVVSPPFSLSPVQGLLMAPVALPASLIGAAPALYWGATHQWQNIAYILRLGNSISSLPPEIRAQYPTRLALVGGLTWLYSHCVAPRIIGGALPGESGNLLQVIHAFTLTLGLVCILAAVLLFSLAFLLHSPLLGQVRQLVALPMLFGISTAFFFCTSTAAAGMVCGGDSTGRYAAPLVLALPFLWGATFTTIVMSLRHRAERQPESADNVAPEGPQSSSVAMVFRQCVTPGGHMGLSVLLCIYLCAQVSTYTLTDPGSTFNSPYCSWAPADDARIIAYLQRESVHYAWTSNWIGFPITFRTHADIITADPRLLVFHSGINRLPTYYNAVVHADRPAILAYINTTDTYPQLLHILDDLHVVYHAQRFPAQHSKEVLVVVPLNRTVSLLESQHFQAVFPLCP